MMSLPFPWRTLTLGIFDPNPPVTSAVRSHEEFLQSPGQSAFMLTIVHIGGMKSLALKKKKKQLRFYTNFF